MIELENEVKKELGSKIGAVVDAQKQFEATHDFKFMGYLRHMVKEKGLAYLAKHYGVFVHVCYDIDSIGDFVNDLYHVSLSDKAETDLILCKDISTAVFYKEDLCACGLTTQFILPKQLYESVQPTSISSARLLTVDLTDKSHALLLHHGIDVVLYSINVDGKPVWLTADGKDALGNMLVEYDDSLISVKKLFWDLFDRLDCKLPSDTNLWYYFTISSPKIKSLIPYDGEENLWLTAIRDKDSLDIIDFNTTDKLSKEYNYHYTEVADLDRIHALDLHIVSSGNDELGRYIQYTNTLSPIIYSGVIIFKENTRYPVVIYNDAHIAISLAKPVQDDELKEKDPDQFDWEKEAYNYTAMNNLCCIEMLKSYSDWNQLDHIVTNNLQFLEPFYLDVKPKYIEYIANLQSAMDYVENLLDESDKRAPQKLMSKEGRKIFASASKKETFQQQRLTTLLFEAKKKGIYNAKLFLENVSAKYLEFAVLGIRSKKYLIR